MICIPSSKLIQNYLKPNLSKKYIYAPYLSQYFLSQDILIKSFKISKKFKNLLIKMFHFEIKKSIL